MDDQARKELEQQVVAALKTVKDPEIPLNVYDLGLIYELRVNDDATVHVTMTLTNPNCPVADKIVEDVLAAVKSVDGVAEATVELTWEPPWDYSRLSEAARLELMI